MLLASKLFVFFRFALRRAGLVRCSVCPDTIASETLNQHQTETEQYDIGRRLGGLGENVGKPRAGELAPQLMQLPRQRAS